MLLALFPPGQPFYRLVMDASAVAAEAQRRGEPGFAAQVDAYLSQQEWTIIRQLDKMRARAALFETMKHLACGGTALLYVGNSFLKMYGLRSIAGERDPEDNVKEIVIREKLSPQNMPAAVRRSINRAMRLTNPDESVSPDQHDLYTHIKYDPRKGDQAVTWHQEYKGNVINGTSGFASMDKSPWLPLRMNKVTGSFYGTGIVEELLGDLTSFNSLSKAIVQGGLGSSKTVGLVNPNGVTRVDALNRAENFDFVSGDPNDVGFLRVDKQTDYMTGLQTMQMIERRLNFAFMLTEAVQRDGERVTAQEITILARQLEESYGGVYTLLSDELQLPLIRRALHVMTRDGRLDDIPEGLVEPQVTTGIDAISRGNEKQRLGSFLGMASQVDPQGFMRYINLPVLFQKIAAADGIDTKDLLKTPEQVQAMENQAQQLQLAGQLATNQSNVIPPNQQGAAAGGGQPGAAGSGQPAAGAPAVDPVAA
jgi:hypothetical protein